MVVKSVVCRDDIPGSHPSDCILETFVPSGAVG